MSNQTIRDRPNVVERVEYLFGRDLPPAMHGWVLHDAAGPGHNRRYFERGVAMFLPLIVIIWVLPIEWQIKVGMSAIVLLPAVYFLTALRHVYLQHLLQDNEFDPDVETGKWLAEHERRAAVYEAKFRSGPRRYA
ncbi:DUF5313 family protein [Tsukamurella soli]